MKDIHRIFLYRIKEHADGAVLGILIGASVIYCVYLIGIVVIYWFVWRI
ncbi:hypothetical protein [Bartonella tribocorum]|nr:hypothetical protein [Bartonella tribocorum]